MVPLALRVSEAACSGSTSPVESTEWTTVSVVTWAVNSAGAAGAYRARQ